MWVLVLYLALGGNPRSAVVIDPVTKQNALYSSRQACRAAGAGWIKPDANPQHTVRTYACLPRSTRSSKASR